MPGPEVESLNTGQRAASDSAAREPLTLVEGPPGTGKSRLVRQVLASAACRRSPALFASKNHEAIAAVVPELKRWGGGQSLILNLARRFKNEDDADRLRLSLSEIAAVSDPAGLAAHRQECVTALIDAEDLRIRTEALLSDVAHAEDRLDVALATFESNASDLPQTWRVVIEREATNLVFLEKATALLRDVERCLPQPGRASVFGNLRRRLRYRLRFEKPSGQMLDRLAALLALQEVERSPRTPQQAFASLSRFRTFISTVAASLEAEKARSRLSECPARAELLDRWAEQNEAFGSASVTAVAAVAAACGADASDEDRRTLRLIRDEAVNLDGAGASRIGDRLGKAVARHFPMLVKHLPLWAVTNLSVGRELPLTAGLFDLLVVDEASQCDIASAVPLLFRSRRVAVVGDPQQLPHVVRLPATTNLRLRARYGLDDIRFAGHMWKQSLYGLADHRAEAKQRHFLAEHRRCHPAISNYCTANFYPDRLEGWADVSTFVGVPTGKTERLGIHWTPTADDARGAPGGGSISDDQVQKIIEELRRLEAARYTGSVGVIAPFAAQKKRLFDQVNRAFNHRFPEAWRMKIDTADGFQGGERDLILLSLVGGTRMPRGSRWFYSRENQSGVSRFNVAVSRGRSLVHVFGNRAWCESLPVGDFGHIKSLLVAAGVEQSTLGYEVRSDLIGPVWEPRLTEALRSTGLDVLPQYPVFGSDRPRYYLDLALIEGQRKLAIEVDGEAWHRGPDGGLRTEDLRRDQALIAGGWAVERFWVYELREDLSGCVERVLTKWRNG